MITDGLLSAQPVVTEYLFRCNMPRLAKEIIDGVAIDQKRSSEFFDVAMAFVDGEIKIPELPELFAAAFEITPEEARGVAARFVGNVLWPLRIFDPSIEQEYRELGGDPSRVNSEKIELPAIGSKEAAEEIVRIIGHEASDFLIQRLGLLVLQYYRGEKTKETLATFLGRPINIGGLAFDKEQIDATMQAIAQVTNGKEIISDAEFNQRRAGYEAERMPVGALQEELKTAPQRKVITLTAKEADAVEVPQRAIEKTREATTLMTPYAAAYEKALEATLSAMPEVVGAHRDAEQKLLDILGMAIRGVRDMYQTRDTLKAQMKLTDVELQGVMAALGKGIEAYAEGGGAGKAGEVPEPVASAVEEIEAAAFDRRFAALTGKAPRESAQPIMPGARVSAARTLQEEVAQSFDKVPEETMRQAEQALRPAPAKVELTVGSIAPSAQHALTDVVPTNRLHGPIEQLGTLGPTEFRRLHPTPEQAAAMVERLINDLQSTAIEERIKGVKAWRMSPMNALYAEISAEALTAGKSVAEIATARRAKGAPSLSPAEMKAVVELNARLRF